MDSSVAPKGEGVVTLRGVDISYEVLGKVGGAVPVVLTPGGGGGKAGLRGLAQKLRGRRQCLVWDRPNCGASSLTLGDHPLQPEPDLQARARRVARLRRAAACAEVAPRAAAGGLPARAAA